MSGNKLSVSGNVRKNDLSGTGCILATMDFFGQQTDDGVLAAIGLRLPGEQEAAIIAMNQMLAEKEGVVYSLNPDSRIPYVRLYETVFPRDNLSKVTAQVQQVVQSVPVTGFAWGDLEETEKVVILWGEINDGIQLLQERLLYALNPLREGYFKQKYTSTPLTLTQKQSLHRWGWPWVEEYNPYVIVGQAKDRFKLAEFELEWDYKYAEGNRLFVAQKGGPGELVERQEYELK